MLNPPYLQRAGVEVVRARVSEHRQRPPRLASGGGHPAIREAAVVRTSAAHPYSSVGLSRFSWMPRRCTMNIGVRVPSLLATNSCERGPGHIGQHRGGRVSGQYPALSLSPQETALPSRLPLPLPLSTQHNKPPLPHPCPTCLVTKSSGEKPAVAMRRKRAGAGSAAAASTR